MDEATRAVQRRLERIDALRTAGSAPSSLLLELRALLGEAEAWVASDAAGSARARAAVEALEDALGTVTGAGGKPRDPPEGAGGVPP